MISFRRTLDSTCKRFKDQITWDYIIFMNEISKINLKYEILQEYADYKPLAWVRGFQKYSHVGLERILSEYGSIKNFIEKIQ